jgi:hypothetical protein
MRASIRRIDLTTEPATVDVWPSIDWLAETPTDIQEVPMAAPRGRGGLWAAMANAVARARESSTLPPVGAPAAEPQRQAEIIDLVLDAPHLAYLASVAAGSEQDDEDADVLSFDRTAREQD